MEPKYDFRKFEKKLFGIEWVENWENGNKFFTWDYINFYGSRYYMNCKLLQPMGIFKTGDFIKLIRQHNGEFILFSDIIAPGYLSGINHIPDEMDYIYSVLTYLKINPDPIFMILEYLNINPNLKKIENIYNYISENIENLKKNIIYSNGQKFSPYYDRLIIKLQDLQKMIRPGFDFNDWRSILLEQIELIKTRNKNLSGPDTLSEKLSIVFCYNSSPPIEEIIDGLSYILGIMVKYD